MSKVLIIGCGGVASVAIHKCCQVPEVFTEICIASRTKAKCDKLAAELAPTTATKITTAQVDADKVEEVIALIKAYQPDLVMNIALPYQDLTIMDACLACGVNYMDTANYEPENTDDPEWRAIYEKRCKEAGFSAYFDYSWQWAYAKKFEEAGLTALLGSGFDPGVTQAYCAYAKKHEFDTIDTIDILDCNGGDHGYAFATNFNPEINLREVSAPGSYWENGHWVEIPAMSIKREYNFDQVGDKDMYLLHHEEIESLAKNIPEAKRIRFFMTFGQSYLDHMRCLEDVGMLSTTPVNFNGQEIVPIQFAALLPDPRQPCPNTKGKTNIGCIFTGKGRQGQDLLHLQRLRPSWRATQGSGAVRPSVTPPACRLCGGALMLLATGKWTTKGVCTLSRRVSIPASVSGCTGQVRLAPLRKPQPGSGGLMRVRDSRPPFAGLASLSEEQRTACPRPCWMKAGCATNGISLGGAAAPAAAFCWRRGLFPTLTSARCWHPICRYRGQRPVRALGQGRAGRRRKTMCSARPTGRTSFAQLLQYADHLRVQLAQPVEQKFGPGGKGGGQKHRSAHNPECSTQEGTKSMTPALPAAVWALPRPVGCRSKPRTRSCCPAGRSALPHLCEQDADAGGNAGSGGGKSLPHLLPKMQWLNFGGDTITRAMPLATLESCILSAAEVRRTGASGARRGFGAERGYSSPTVLDTPAQRGYQPCHSGYVRSLHPRTSSRCPTARRC